MNNLTPYKAMRSTWYEVLTGGDVASKKHEAAMNKKRGKTWFLTFWAQDITPEMIGTKLGSINRFKNAVGQIELCPGTDKKIYHISALFGGAPSCFPIFKSLFGQGCYSYVDPNLRNIGFCTKPGRIGEVFIWGSGLTSEDVKREQDLYQAIGSGAAGNGSGLLNDVEAKSLAKSRRSSPATPRPSTVKLRVPFNSIPEYISEPGAAPSKDIKDIKIRGLTEQQSTDFAVARLQLHEAMKANLAAQAKLIHDYEVLEADLKALDTHFLDLASESKSPKSKPELTLRISGPSRSNLDFLTSVITAGQPALRSTSTSFIEFLSR